MKEQKETKEVIEMDGVITDKIPGGKFKVQLESGQVITATPCGKIRVNKITLVIGDRVQVEISPYDITNGRIKWRKK